LLEPSQVQAEPPSEVASMSSSVFVVTAMEQFEAEGQLIDCGSAPSNWLELSTKLQAAPLSVVFMIPLTFPT
jgi:hypothetical protein